MTHTIQGVISGFFLLALVVSLAPSNAFAEEVPCGATTCTAGTEVCCNAMVGGGPQCIAGAECPVGTVNHTTGRVIGPANPPASTDSSRPSNDNSSANAGNGQTLMNPLKVGSVEALLVLLLDAIIQIGLILLVLAIVWVGFLFVAAQGKEEKIREARGALLWTVVGGMLLLGARVIADVIQATVNTL